MLGGFLFHLYIDGVKHQVVRNLGDKVLVDHPDHPGVPCSQHHLDRESQQCLLSGGKVFASGQWYSLHPDPEPAHTALRIKPTIVQRLRAAFAAFRGPTT